MIDFSTELGQKAKHHLENEYFVWLTTISAGLLPQPRPVWFVWRENGFLIYSKPQTNKIHHLQEHKGVALHFNTSDKKGEQNVIVFTGQALLDTSLPRAEHLPEYLAKYAAGISDLGFTPQSFGDEYSVPIYIQPVGVRGW
jgi:PPOX class probable F420-dependent enzyme